MVLSSDDILRAGDHADQPGEPVYTFKSRPEPPPRRRRSRVQEGKARPYEEIRQESVFGAIFLDELDHQNIKLQYIADRMRLDRDRLIYRLNRPRVFSIFDILQLAHILHLDPVEFVTVWLVSMRKAEDPAEIAPQVVEMLVVDELLRKIKKGEERARAFRIVESVLMTLTEDGNDVEVGEVLSRASQKLTNNKE